MRTRNIFAIALLAAGLGLASGQALSQEDAKKPGPPPFEQPSPEEMQEQMARWMETCRTSEHHKGLARFLGTWDLEMTMWGMGPEPMKSTGTAKTTWLIENRWLQTKSDENWMGMAMKGAQTLGYDIFRQKYVWSKVDSFTTAMLVAEGRYDKDRKNLVFYGPLDEPMTGEPAKPVKYVWKMVDDDSYVIEVHDLSIGLEDTKVVEIKATRQK